MNPNDKEKFLFPFDEIRDEQDKLILSIDKAIETKNNLICHAPTGLGKTIASLGPALKFAIDNNKTIFFLTSRHTQHAIAIDTLKKIKGQFNTNFNAVSIIGKKWMCAQPGVDGLYSKEFSEYCKAVRQDNKCEFYSNTKKSNKLTPKAKDIINHIKIMSPIDTEKLIDICTQEKLCPYEISLALASNSKVIISDYYYLFHPNIGDNFLKKIDKEIEDLIVIVDEGHNLPYRLKDLASEYLTTTSIRRAIKELEKYGYTETVSMVQNILDALKNLAGTLTIGKEKLVKKEDFTSLINMDYDYDQMISDLEYIGDTIRETKKQSYTGAIAGFMTKWMGKDKGFVRIISYNKGLREPYHMLSYRCLDPSIVCADIINNSHSTIIMSGTLNPPSMYRELLGVKNACEKAFKDPYPKDNRLNIIIPKTTTKYAARSESQYKEIASVCADIVNTVPGNTALFFPSYFLRDKISHHFEPMSKKTIFQERSGMGKNEKKELLEKFKGYNSIGAALMAVSAGSFGEGIDLPGDLLKAVVVVGLPLSQPNLETKSLIEYYNKKLGKGWDYGYIFPAFNKCLQSAGRCIRSETDRGVIVFLDQRFTWNNYFKCFPIDWKLKITLDYTRLIKEFFSNNDL